MSRPKSRHVGAGVLIRYRNGACTFTCRHDGCRAYSEPHSWRAGLRQARNHAADHDAAEASYVGTPWGIPAGELPRTTQGRLPLRRLAAAATVVLVLAAIAFAVTVAGMASRAAPAPVPSIGIVTTTTPAGPPATDRQGQWIPKPNPSTSTSSSTGGGR
jgi:hypothetical protein